MESSELTARLRYLNETAHYLATSAPATSKHLMSQCNSLMFEAEIEQPEPQSRRSCLACGTIITSGWGGVAKVQPTASRKKSRKQESKKPSSREKSMVYTCASCFKTTRHRLEPAPPISRAKKAALPPVSVSKPVATALNNPSAPSANANANSKKRAKTRKLGGLGALLANKKASEARSSGFGLDLMDLMKQT
ncbi:RNAse p rpr2 rpp21 snm1 subunit domain-containing protein [Rutstroemia sp. NJR-2017a WRK4]|nr:RNAse p rpr2 rpp21 snm1 subunit domain-containing protein [Rutstroemia sp. NJR-2017a WRK4]